MPSCYQPMPCELPQQQAQYPCYTMPQETQQPVYSCLPQQQAYYQPSAYASNIGSLPQVSIDMPITQTQTSSMALGSAGGLQDISSSGINFSYA